MNLVFIASSVFFNLWKFDFWWRLDTEKIVKNSIASQQTEIKWHSDIFFNQFKFHTRFVLTTKINK